MTRGNFAFVCECTKITVNCMSAEGRRYCRMNNCFPSRCRGLCKVMASRQVDRGCCEDNGLSRDVGQVRRVRSSGAAPVLLRVSSIVHPTTQTSQWPLSQALFT